MQQSVEQAGAPDLDSLFACCDLNGSGYIEREELLQLCADIELTELEFNDVFDELDRDMDGKISREDFKKGFDSVTTLFTNKRMAKEDKQDKQDTNKLEYNEKERIASAVAWEQFLHFLDLGFYLLTSERFCIAKVMHAHVPTNVSQILWDVIYICKVKQWMSTVRYQHLSVHMQ